MKNIKFKKKKRVPKALIAAVCVVVTAVIVAAGFLIADKLMNKDDKPEENKNYTFETKGFENITEVKSLNEAMAVFTDGQTGKKGLMTFGGKVTENAEHNSFSVCSDVWRNYRYIVESPRSEYLLLADVETGTVTSRQYHGLQTPERIPCWNETAKHLAWTDGAGYAGEVKSSEVKLENGLHPVANSLKDGAKYGYIGRNLRLEIALLYENAADFSNDMAAVKKDGKWGYINEGGVTVIPFDFESCAAADAMGRDCSFSFRGGLAPVCKGGKFGIINKKAETVVNFEFDAILPGENGSYIACKNGVWGILTLDEKLLAAQTTAPSTAATNISSEPALAKGTYMIKTSGSVLNMRSAADPNSSVVAKIPNGTVITVTKSVTGWAYAKYNSFSGWVSADFLVEYKEPVTTVPSTAATTANTSQTLPNSTANV